MDLTDALTDPFAGALATACFAGFDLADLTAGLETDFETDLETGLVTNLEAADLAGLRRAEARKVIG
jgi:hypothetical protein